MSTNYTPTNVSGDNTETAINQNFSDIQDALEASLSRNAGDTHGSNAMQTDIDANGNTVMNLRYAQNATEAVPKAQFEEILGDFGIDSNLVDRIEDSVAAIEATTVGNTAALINHKWAPDSNNVPLTSYIDPTQFYPIGLTPTFVSNASFTVPGDQTGEARFAVGKRLKIVHNGGATTEYKDVVSAAYQAGPVNTLVTIDGTSLVTPINSVAIGPGTTNLNINDKLIRDSVEDQPLSTTLATLKSDIATIEANDWVTEARILDDNVTLDKMEHGTQGNLLYYGASGAPLRLAVGTNGQVLKTQGAAANPQWGNVVNLAAAAASTSGTEVLFTGIPSWVKKISVLLSGVSTNGIFNLILQLGDAGGIETTGYEGTTGSSATVSQWSIGAVLSMNTSASNLHHGVVELYLMDASTNTWVISVVTGFNNNILPRYGAGSKSLSAALTQFRLTTAGGLNTFDAGKVSYLYQ